ncbi:hypothetical protein [Nocardioides renjunii]|uniref:hypothetical protein n=1 Tax=Nocardioides renjunii TaxID=3095075 RepID=UPI002AFFD2B2|nr:hypothetical protein [Nocardioides sp. S-34]WQQ23950.1 hypothetical protein SHK17_08160 [Nocardioides sp. S-34]
MQRWSSWLNGTLALGSVGVCAALVEWGPSRLLAVTIPVTCIVTLAHIMVRVEHRTTGGVLGACVSVVRSSASATSLLLLAYVLASLHLGLGLLLVAGLVVTAPPVRDAVRRRSRLQRVGWNPAAPDPAAVTPSGVAHLTDSELTHAWCHTSRALDGVTHPGRRLALVITRQHLLDEMWARDREALEAWVACGARPADRPPRYFRQP